MDLATRVASVLGSEVGRVHRLSGGCVADVVCADLNDGRRVVVKHGGDGFGVEALMLRALASRSHLPVPAVLYDEPDLLILEHIEHDGSRGPGLERHAAELLAALHGVAGPAFGFDTDTGLGTDTLIGPLRQPCPPSRRWVEFFARHRLGHFGDAALEAGAITASCRDRLRRLCDRLEDVLDEPEHPSLIHGDIWSGNVLCHRGRVAACIDPALHYAHPEVELAFITLFSTFGEAFFDRYHELRPIREGFFETRRHVYNLYPLLIHAILFGGGYARQVEATLGRVGA
ncbi:MAG: fructosamine kinase family protein [Phycisphaerales bacterium JB041]